MLKIQKTTEEYRHHASKPSDHHCGIKQDPSDTVTLLHQTLMQQRHYRNRTYVVLTQLHLPLKHSYD